MTNIGIFLDSLHLRRVEWNRRRSSRKIRDVAAANWRKLFWRQMGRDRCEILVLCRRYLGIDQPVNDNRYEQSDRVCSLLWECWRRFWQQGKELRISVSFFWRWKFLFKPHAESHAGLIYCCVGFLSITHSLHHIECEKLAWWLCERQLTSGGLNGRPEKLPDVCYS